jgi:3'-5' exoribonuclease
MSRVKKPPLMKLSDFQIGQYGDCFVQLAAKSRGSTREGKPYYLCRFREPRRDVGVMVWADSAFFDDCQNGWLVGQFFKLRGTLGEHPKYGLQFDPEQVRPIEERDRVDGFNELDFIEKSRFDNEQMFGELIGLVEAGVKDEPLRQLVRKILDDNAAGLKVVPASTRHAYIQLGGWLEHTLNVARNCISLADYYATHFSDLKPPLNRDLIVAGAVLHDIGRVKSVEVVPEVLPPRTGIAGELFGHIHLGYDLIRAAARDIPELNTELLELLLHMLVSHIRQPESEGPRSPRIPEVLILHYADELDSKFEMYARCLRRDSTTGPFTERDAILGKTLLKKRKV